MTRFPFLNPLEDLIVEQFDVLRREYAREEAQEVLAGLAAAIEQENEVRYAIVNGDTGRLASPFLFDTRRETLAYRDRRALTGCRIATLILDEQP
jgi:hypothetical protein